MKATKIIATLALATVLFTGCGIKGQGIIKVNNDVITLKEFNELFDKQVAMSPFARMGGVENFKKDKDGMLYLMTEQRVINQLVIQKLLDQEAKERGIKTSKKEVDKAIKETIEKIGGQEQLMRILKENQVSVGQFKKDIQTQVKMRKLAASTFDKPVTDADCKKFYQDNLDKFKHDEQVRASHILIAANPFQIQQELLQSNPKMEKDEIVKKVEAAVAEKKAKAEKLAKELKADKSKFIQYAKQYSEDPGSKDKGGDLGFFSKKQMVPEFANASWKAKPDTVTGPVKSEYGYHIILVSDRREAGVVPYEKAKSDIKAYLTSEKEIKALDELTQAAKKKSEIKYLDESYNPEKINERLHKQVNELTNGAKDKFDVQGQSKKPAPKAKDKAKK